MTKGTLTSLLATTALLAGLPGLTAEPPAIPGRAEIHAPPPSSTRGEPGAVPCPPPDFRLDGRCWTELRKGQDCRVPPLVMELEDQPVYCPRQEVVPVPR